MRGVISFLLVVWTVFSSPIAQDMDDLNTDITPFELADSALDTNGALFADTKNPKCLSEDSNEEPDESLDSTQNEIILQKRLNSCPSSGKTDYSKPPGHQETVTPSQRQSSPNPVKFEPDRTSDRCTQKHFEFFLSCEGPEVKSIYNPSMLVRLFYRQKILYYLVANCLEGKYFFPISSSVHRLNHSKDIILKYPGVILFQIQQDPLASIAVEYSTKMWVRLIQKKLPQLWTRSIWLMNCRIGTSLVRLLLPQIDANDQSAAVDNVRFGKFRRYSS